MQKKIYHLKFIRYFLIKLSNALTAVNHIMRSLFTVLFFQLFFLTFIATTSVQAENSSPIPTDANQNELHVTRSGENYFQLALINMHFYLVQFRHEVIDQLSPQEINMWDKLTNLMSTHNRQAALQNPNQQIKLAASDQESMFSLDGKEPRFAVTAPFQKDPFLRDPIWFNARLFPATMQFETKTGGFTYAEAVQILIHELGHKVPQEDKAATDKIAQLIKTKIAQYSEVLQKEGSQYEFVLIDTTHIYDSSDIPLRHDEIVVFRKQPSNLSMIVLNQLNLGRNGNLETQNQALKFYRSKSVQYNERTLHFGINYEVRTTAKKPNLAGQNLLGGPIDEISNIYQVKMTLKNDGLSFSISQGSRISLDYAFKIERTVENPRFIEVTGVITGEQVENQIKNSFLVIESASASHDIEVEQLKVEPIDSQKIRVTYRLNNKQGVSVQNLKATAIKVETHDLQRIKIPFEKPIDWSLVQYRNKRTINKKDLRISWDFIQTIARLGSSGEVFLQIQNMDPAADIHEIKLILMLKAQTDDAKSVVRYPLVLTVNSTTTKLNYSEDKKTVTFSINFENLLLGNTNNLKYRDNIDNQLFEKNEIKYSFNIQDAVIIDKSFKEITVANKDQNEFSFNGNVDFRNPSTRNKKNEAKSLCPALFK